MQLPGAGRKINPTLFQWKKNRVPTTMSMHVLQFVVLLYVFSLFFSLVFCATVFSYCSSRELILGRFFDLSFCAVGLFNRYFFVVLVLLSIFK